MKSRILIYDDKVEDQVQKSIVPAFGTELKAILPFSYDINERLQEGDQIITFLSDEQLKSFLIVALDKGFELALLPHPKMDNGIKGFGIKEDIEENINHILLDEKLAKVDLLEANGVPVFNTIIIGESLSLMSGSIARFGWQRFWQRLSYFFKLFFNTRLNSFKIKAGDQEEINTAAIGLIIVHHAQSSLLSKRILEHAVINDGKLHAFILAPKSISGLFWFVLSSFFRKKGNTTLPPFAAHIKTSTITITGDKAIDYSQDGILLSTDLLQVEVCKGGLNMVPGQKLDMENKGGSDDVFKIEALPRGDVREELLKRKLPLINHATTEEFKDLFSNLRASSVTSSVYLVLMFLATLIATLGLFGNSAPVIIGAMILAPLMAPIISLSMGVLRQDRTLILNSSKTIGWGVLLGYICAIFITWLTPLNIANDEILARVRPNLLDLGIAVGSGIAGAYASAKSEISKTLAGVAIAVALVPPLAVSGIGLGWMDWDIFQGAFLLFLTNLAGMVMAAAMTFLFLGFSPFRLARRGILYSLIVVALVSLPLFFGFMDMVRENNIISKLNGYANNGVILRDISVRNIKPIRLTVKIVADGTLDKGQLDIIKDDIERLLGEKVELEVTVALKVH
ncbi:TIGR00341 family protein [uncultured Cyclobacterium sp.]|uniref:TIGR00341 family protein n=1 Tax=uncultured Cyclobacterium sp. TaxID=453820 RepID=UPI0030EDA477|tara:strand:+ start:77525 stop:79399 length:1875 start_codon:yes stop_codon:yes gene_type:complete